MSTASWLAPWIPPGVFATFIHPLCVQGLSAVGLYDIGSSASERRTHWSFGLQVSLSDGVNTALERLEEGEAAVAGVPPSLRLWTMAALRMPVASDDHSAMLLVIFQAIGPFIPSSVQKIKSIAVRPKLRGAGVRTSNQWVWIFPVFYRDPANDSISALHYLVLGLHQSLTASPGTFMHAVKESCL